MLIYKFKIVNDENDNFCREIEIKPGNTFMDFHEILLDCIKLSPGEMASFYICDSKWNKLQEITLCDMAETEEAKEEEESEAKPVKMMSDVKLKESINDPHQRMIYVYDFLKMNTFYIELSKISEGEEKNTYPRCVKCVSDIIKPKRVVPKNEEVQEVYDDEELVEGNDDVFSDDTSFNDDDMNLEDSFDDGKYL